jgi:hypothetical protein
MFTTIKAKFHAHIIHKFSFGTPVTVTTALTVNNVLLGALFLDKDGYSCLSNRLLMSTKDVMEFLEGRSQVLKQCLLIYALHPRCHIVTFIHTVLLHTQTLKKCDCH